MIQRFYVHNFRCLENFELSLGGRSSCLLIGNNGSGKSTVGFALQILQKIAQGTNRVADLVKPQDFAWGRPDAPMRFEIEVDLGGSRCEYRIAIGLSGLPAQMRVFAERLTIDNRQMIARSGNQKAPDEFAIDRRLLALPILQERSALDPLFLFKQWLSRMLILRPIPSLIDGGSKEETLQPQSSVSNFGAWFAGVNAETPSAYAKVDSYLRDVMPEISDIKNPVIGFGSRSLVVQFVKKQLSVTVPFADLSDGEKCFMIAALVIASKAAYPPLFCFWDEPDNYLALQEVGHFVVALRKTFHTGGQLVTTSHNPEAIRQFSSENTLLLDRQSRLEPTIVRDISSVDNNGDLIGAMTRGDLYSREH